MTHLFAAAQWTTIIAGLIGLAGPHITTWLHREDAPDWLIALTAQILASIATAIMTVVVHPHDSAKVVLGNIAVAIGGAVFGHKTSAAQRHIKTTAKRRA